MCSKPINGSIGCKPGTDSARLPKKTGPFIVSFSCLGSDTGRDAVLGAPRPEAPVRAWFFRTFCGDLPAAGWPQYTAFLMSRAFASSFLYQFWYFTKIR